jgi:hypothetical protein
VPAEEGADHVPLLGIVPGQVLNETGSPRSPRLENTDHENGTAEEAQGLEVQQKERAVGLLGPGAPLTLGAAQSVYQDPMALARLDPTTSGEGFDNGATQVRCG